MKPDLENMSRDELLELRSQVDDALNTVEKRRVISARQAAEAAVKEYGLSLEEVMALSKKKGQKNPAKYVNLDDPKKTWSGRGRQPAWIKDALAQGRSLDEFLVDGGKTAK